MLKFFVYLNLCTHRQHVELDFGLKMPGSTRNGSGLLDRSDADQSDILGEQF